MNEKQAIRAAALQIAVTMLKLPIKEQDAENKDVLEEVIQKCLPLVTRLENYIRTGA
jgi:hypothetical protein